MVAMFILMIQLLHQWLLSILGPKCKIVGQTNRAAAPLLSSIMCSNHGAVELISRAIKQLHKPVNGLKIAAELRMIM